MALTWQLTVRDPGDLEAGISRYEHRHVYDSEEEAEEARKKAEEAGFEAKWVPIKTRDRESITASTYIPEEPCFDWCPVNPVYAGKLEDAAKWLFGNEPDHNLADWTYDKTMKAMGLEPCHDCHGSPGEAGCMSCDDTGINPFPNAGSKLAQDGGGDGGGGDGGSAPGSGPGGDAYGGGAPDTGAGATLGESPHGSYHRPKVRRRWVEDEELGWVRPKVAQVDVTPAEPGDRCEEDGQEAIAVWKGKRMCVQHLRQGIEKAIEELPQAAEGVATTIGPTRLKWENVVQDTKEDVKAAQDVLEQEDLKKRIKSIQSASDHDYGPCPDCGLPWWDGAPKCPTCGLDIEDLEAASEWMDQATVVPRHLAPPKTADYDTGEDMYNCERCGGQATHEAVTHSGARGLLCPNHATTYKLASQAAGLGTLVFPLTKEAFDLASCPGCGHYLENHSAGACSGSLSERCACKKEAHGPDPDDLKEHIDEDQGEFEDLKEELGELSDKVQGMVEDDEKLKGKLAQVVNLSDPPREPVESQLKGQCVRCGKDVYVGDASKFDNLGEDKWACGNCAPRVAQNLETYRSASAEHLAYLYEQDPDWEKVGQNIGCPNCEGMGHTADGKICQACFGTGHGGGMMIHPSGSVQAGLAEGLTNLFDVADKNLNACPGNCGCTSGADCKCQGCPEALKNAQQPSPKGVSWPLPAAPAPPGPVAASKEAQVDMPPDAAYGILYGDDGDTYQTTDGVNWKKVGATGEPERQTCSICGQEPAFMKVHLETGAEVHWGGKCVQDVKAGRKPGSWVKPTLDTIGDLTREEIQRRREGATEHSEEEEEEDDDLKLFRQDHGAGQGNPTVHSEIHQQEHTGSGYPGPGWGTTDQCVICHRKFDDMQLNHGVCPDCRKRTGSYDDANVNGMARDLDRLDYARIEDPEAYRRDCCGTWNDEPHSPGCPGHGLKQGSFQKEAPYGIPKDKGGDSVENDEKMEDCVKKVMAKGKASPVPWGTCRGTGAASAAARPTGVRPARRRMNLASHRSQRRST
jgi:hypothetical protein